MFRLSRYLTIPSPRFSPIRLLDSEKALTEYVQSLESTVEDLQQRLDDANEKLADEIFDHQQTRQASGDHVHLLEEDIKALQAGASGHKEPDTEHALASALDAVRNQLVLALVLSLIPQLNRILLFLCPAPILTLHVYYVLMSGL